MYAPFMFFYHFKQLAAPVLSTGWQKQRKNHQNFNNFKPVNVTGQSRLASCCYLDYNWCLAASNTALAYLSWGIILKRPPPIFLKYLFLLLSVVVVFQARSLDFFVVVAGGGGGTGGGCYWGQNGQNYRNEKKKKTDPLLGLFCGDLGGGGKGLITMNRIKLYEVVLPILKS